ncbi:MAG: sulfatase-like hydrolase/transferase [Planctomycetes bacterium]|nr:sulfatase-like hydrolase/transferase [Planctomycetota bacterium]
MRRPGGRSTRARWKRQEAARARACAPAALLAALLGLLSACSRAPGEGPAGPRPNVVVLLTDDLGFADTGPYGASDVSTPTLDRLAQEGVRLTDFYAAAPVCTPSRAALLSGCYPQRLGMEWAIPAADRAPGLHPPEAALARLLKERGYATGLVGKWHLGYRKEFSPRAHGFDEFFGLLGPCHDYYTHRDQEGRLDLFDGETEVQCEGYTTDLISERAVRFIAEHAEQPFFLLVAYNAPHWPFQRPDLAPDSRGRLLQADDWPYGTREDYLAMVERLDRGVGLLLAELEARALGRDTLVVFTGDNGGEVPARNTPLAGGKASLQEGGIRVPCILRWPSRLPAGQVSREPAITMDLTATILAAAGARPPQGAPCDGIDLLPALTGSPPAEERVFCWRIDRSDVKERAVRRGKWKYLRRGGMDHLYNLERDIGEETDFAHRSLAILRSLQEALDAWEADIGRERPRMVVK